jgi:hypothetical protein
MKRRNVSLKQLEFSIFSAILFVAAIANFLPVYSEVETKLAISPKILYTAANTFSVNVTVVNAEYLFAWQANLTFNKNVLKLTSITEGDFFARQPEGTLVASNIRDSWALFGVTTKGQSQGVSGSGNLATLLFQVMGQGISLLDIRETNRTYLQAQTSPYPPPDFEFFDFTIQDGIFVNTITPPVADFDYSPKPPAVNQSMTFNASISSAAAPLEIVDYIWDFDDGTNATVDTPMINHTFTVGGVYHVKLTVTDDAEAPPEVVSFFGGTGMPLEWYSVYSTVQKSVAVSIPHDIDLTQITLSKTEVSAGETVVIKVKVLNGGTETDDASVTAYYGNNAISTKAAAGLAPGEERELSFNWDTSGVAAGDYRIKAVAAHIEGEVDFQNNEKIGGTVRVTESSQQLPIPLIAGGVVAAVIVVLVIALLMRRRKHS